MSKGNEHYVIRKKVVLECEDSLRCGAEWKRTRCRKNISGVSCDPTHVTNKTQSYVDVFFLLKEP